MFTDFSSTLDFVKSSSYFLIFIAMVIEGPMITASAAFAASLGYFNIYLIFGLSLFGNLIGDIVHYYFGRFLRKAVIERYIKKRGIRDNQIKKLDEKIHNNLWKSMMLIKMTPPLSTPGLLLIGSSKVPILRYMTISFITILPLTIFYTLLGFYFGFVAKTILDYFKIGEYALFFVILIAVIFLLYRLVYKKVIGKIKKWLKL
jgi:membrane protein DedA with SNARE-associated domain